MRNVIERGGQSMNRVQLLGGAGAVALCAMAFAPTALAADYPPSAPTMADGICVGDIPYFSYEVNFGSDQYVGRPMTITFVNPAGADYTINTTVPAAGQRQSVLWPGAAEQPNPDWPGWELDASGKWVETTTDAGAFTRAPGGVVVKFATNPTVSTSVTYPPASAVCANPTNPGTTAGDTETSTNGGGSSATPTGSSAAGTTPKTGADLALPVALGLTALGVGGGLLVAARARRKA